MNVKFSDEIEDFKQALEEKRQKLKELEEKRDAHAVQTEKARAALEDLRAVLKGETPPSKRSTNKTVRGISAVPVDDETDRPARGARRKQIEKICRKLGTHGDIFQTADVLDVLRDVELGPDEDDLSPGMRSYTYTVMNTLEDDDVLEKKGRGKWRLKK